MKKKLCIALRVALCVSACAAIVYLAGGQSAQRRILAKLLPEKQ